jgi:transglutaminase-like putative cysteine protease
VKRARPTVPRIVLAMAATPAMAGLLVALRAWWLAPAVAASALSPFVEWDPVPPWLARALPRTLPWLLLFSFLLLWFTPAGPEPGGASRLPAIAGTLLAALGCAFAFAPRAFPAWRSLVPTLVGVLAVAANDPAAGGYGVSALPAFRQAGHDAFADLYLALALVVVVALWAAALVSWGPRWNQTARGVAVIAGCLALASAGVLGLPMAQPHLERIVIAALDPGPATGLSHESTLGEFAQLARSRRRVLDVRSSLRSGGSWLLRSEVLIRFDGRRWARGPATRRPLLLVPAAEPHGSRMLTGLGAWFVLPTAAAASLHRSRIDELRITQHALDNWPLLLPRGATAVTTDASLLELDADGLVTTPPGSTPRLYGATAPAPPPDSHDEEGRRAALVLPAAVDARVRALAARLGGEAGSAGEKIARVLRYLDDGYEYSLEPGAFRADADPVAQFLFEKRRGYCEYFATAAVLLLRLQGVPARFVKGLRAGPHNDYGGGLFVVRESDAHAWVEAWEAGRGWIELDPTPGGPLGIASQRPGWAARTYERLRATAVEAWARLLGPGPLSLLRWLGDLVLDLLGDPLRALVVLVLAVVGLGGRRILEALQQRRRGAAPPEATDAAAVSPQLRRAIQALDRRWRQIGHPRPPSRGWREHARWLAARTGPEALPAGLAAAASGLVEAYYRARFGRQAASDPEVGRLQAVIDGQSPAAGP